MLVMTYCNQTTHLIVSILYYSTMAHLTSSVVFANIVFILSLSLALSVCLSVCQPHLFEYTSPPSCIFCNPHLKSRTTASLVRGLRSPLVYNHRVDGNPTVLHESIM